MIWKKTRRLFLVISSGSCLWLSCPSGTNRLVAQAVQPVLTQLFTDIATALTDGLIGDDGNP
ncbi:MAG: hypothetical protein AABZ47_02865 [Planctomycetota bacterium]